MKNPYKKSLNEGADSRRYEIDSDKEVYNKIANHPDLRKIYGEVGDSLFVGGSTENLFLIEKKNNKEIIKIHSEKPAEIQLQLEKITGINLSQYRIY